MPLPSGGRSLEKDVEAEVVSREAEVVRLSVCGYVTYLYRILSTPENFLS